MVEDLEVVKLGEEEQQDEDPANPLHGGQDRQDEDSDTESQDGSAEEIEESAEEDGQSGERLSDSSPDAENEPLLEEPSVDVEPIANAQPDPSPQHNHPGQQNEQNQQNPEIQQRRRHRFPPGRGPRILVDMPRSVMLKVHTPLYTNLVLWLLAAASPLFSAVVPVDCVCGLTSLIVFTIGVAIFVCDWIGYTGAMFLLPHSVFLPMYLIYVFHRIYINESYWFGIELFLAAVVMVAYIGFCCNYIPKEPRERKHDYKVKHYRSLSNCSLAGFVGIWAASMGLMRAILWKINT